MTELLQSGANCLDRSSCYPIMESDKLLQPGGEDESEHQSTPTQARHHLRLRNWTSSNVKTILLALLLMSCAVNILQSAYVLAWYNPPMRDGPACEQSYPVIDVPITPLSSFSSSSNRTNTDALWWSLDTSRGFVALDKKQPNLKTSETFPWDESKSVYLIKAFHGLHCLRVIYIYIRQLQTQEDLRYDFSHVLHCLDSLRSDVLCAADDTPIAVGNQPDGGPQLQVQTRKCRDWGQLEEFVTVNSACFQGHEPDEPGYQTIEEWQHCPKESPYWATVQKYLLESGSV